MTSAQIPSPVLDGAFGLSDHSYIFLIGGGGKTTLMFALAHSLMDSGHTVVSTTTTKILRPPAEEVSCVIVEKNVDRAASLLRKELSAARHITLGKTQVRISGKLHGYAAEELDGLWREKIADYMIVEADGSAGKSLKAHAAHEPVISGKADLVIAVIGSDCIGCPLDDAHVHRAERFGRLIGKAPGTPLSADDVATIFFHPLGYLKAFPPTADVIVLISKVADDVRRSNAERLAAALKAADCTWRISRIVIGELAGATPFLEARG